MATIYSWRECGTNLNLQPSDLFALDFYLIRGRQQENPVLRRRGSVQITIREGGQDPPFLETVNYWGILKKRMKIKCNSCGKLVSYVYDDGLPLMNGTGQFGFGLSQAIPRNPSYRFLCKCLPFFSSF